MANQNTPSKSKVNVGSWAKNMGKSLGLSTKDIIRDMAPTTIETTENFAEVMKSINSTLKARKNYDMKSTVKTSLGKKVDIAKTALKNAKDDIRTGNLYNNERVSSMYDDEMFGDLDFGDGDMNFSDDFDDSSFDESSGDNKSSTKVVVPNVNITTNINKNNPMVTAVTTQTDVMLETAKATLSQDAVLAKSSMQLTKEVGSSLYEGISAVNSNLGKMLTFQSSAVTTYMNSSLKYYDDSLKIMSEFLETYKTHIAAPTGQEKTNAYSQDAINMYTGAFNPTEYLKLVKKQFMGFAGDNLLLSSIMNAASDEDTLAGIAAQPLKFISDKIIKTAIPKFFESTLQEFDKSLSAFFPALGMKLFGLGDSDNPILSAIGKIFGIKTENKSSVDLGKFEKGPVPFDGITKKSIVEVIPGYLSKILSAITGSEAELFDSNTGTFKKISKIKEEHDNTVRSRTLSEYEYLSEVKDAVNAFGIQDSKSRDALYSKIDQLFEKITDTNKLVNIFKDGGSELTSLLDSLDGGVNNGERTIIKNALMTMDKSKLMRTFGLDAMKSRTAKSQLFYDIESGSNAALNSVFNGLFSEDEMKPGSVSKKRTSLFSPEDEHGHTSLYYLRSIYNTLLEGVKVFVAKTNVSGEYKHNSKLSELMSENQKYRDSIASNISSRINITDAMRANAANQGRVLYQDTDSMFDLSDDEAARIIKNAREYNKESETSKPSKVEKFMPKTVKEAIGKLRNSIANGPARILNGFIEKMNTTMFEVVFGKDDSDEPQEKQSLITRMINSVSGKLDVFFEKINTTFFEPIKNALFGEDGMFTKFKQSDTYKKLKDKATKATNYLFGEKDEEGIRRNGLFSETGAAISDMSKSLKYYFTGSEYKDSNGVTYPKNPNSVFGEVKNIFSGFKSTMKEYFFGDKAAEGKDKAKGILSGITDSLQSGFQNFANALFGPAEINGKKNNNHVIITELKQKIKDRMPKSLATGVMGAGAGLLLGGKLGILGSLLLPGGPIGGAILGTTVGFLSQSNTFKDWLFGKQDPKTKERIGGIISKSTQEFFKKHKTGLVGGAAVGTLKGALGFGLLPGFIFGGPVGGALMGMGSSLLFRSEKFQNLMFGEKDESGKRVGGILSKIMNKADSGDAKKRAGSIGAGALGGLGIGAILSQFGMLGAFAFGPLSGAILGAVAGISLTSDKWKKALFGEMDVDEATGQTFRKGGLLTKFSNMLSVEVMQPLKIGLLETKFKFEDWFDENIKEKVLDSIEPFRHEIDNIKTNIKEALSSIKDKILNSNVVQSTKEYLFDPIVEGFRDHVIRPFQRLTKFLIGGAGKIIGGIAKTPFKALEMVANKLAAKHEKQGISAYREKIIENLKNTQVGKAFTVVADGVDWIKEKTVSMTKSFLSTLGEGVKLIVKGAFKTLSTVIQAPFKLLAMPFKAIGNLRKNGKNGKNYDVQDQGLLDQISGGNRGFFQSIGDLVRISMPGSQLRHDARYSEEGAVYQSERQRKRQERADARAAKKQQHADLINNMRNQLDANRQIALKLGYDNVDENGNLMNGAYKDIDKQMQALYGKDYKKLSQAERNRFAEDQLQKMNTNEIAANTKSTSMSLDKIFEFLTNKLNQPLKTVDISHTDESDDAVLQDVDVSEDNAHNIINFSGQAQAVKAALDVNEKEEDAEEQEEKEDAVLKEKHAKVRTRTASNLKASNALQAEKEQELSWRQKMVDLLSRGNKTREEQKSSWDSIFSKKGLIGAALILALPLITKFFQDPSQFFQDMLNTAVSVINSIDFSGLSDAIKNAVRDALGLGDGENNDRRTDSTGDVEMDDSSVESLVRGGFKTIKNIDRGINLFKYKRTAKTITKTSTKYTKELRKLGYSSDEVAEIIAKSKKAGQDAALHGGSKKDVMKAMDDVIVKETSGVGDNAADAVIKNSDEIVEAGIKGSDNAAGAVLSKGDEVAKAAKSGKKITVKAAKSGGDNAANAVVNIADDVVESGVKSSGSKLVTETTETVVKETSEGVISKFIKIAKTSIGELLEKLIKKFPSLDKIAFKAIDEVIPKLLKVPVLGKFVGKISTGVTKFLSSSATLGIVDAGFFVYGVATGASKSETANLFGISSDDVDGTMQTISSFFKGILNMGWFFIIDILNTIAKEVLGINFISSLAIEIYKFLKRNDQEALDKFEQDKMQFGQDYNDYTLAQQILKGNVERDAEGNIVRDAQGNAVYKDASLVESQSSYNDRVNKSALGNLWDKTKSVAFDAKSFLFGNKGDSAKLTDIQAQKKALDDAVARGEISADSDAYRLTMESLNEAEKKYTQKDSVFVTMGDSIKGFFTKIGDSFSNGFESVKNALSTIWDGTKDNLKDILAGKSSVFTKEYWTAPESGDEGSSGISKGLFYVQRVLGVIPGAVLSIGRGVYDKVKPVIDNVKNALSSVWDMTKSDFSNLISGNSTVFSKDYWTAPDADDATGGGISKGLFYGQRVLTLLPAAVISVGRSVYDKVKPVIDKVAQILRFVGNSTKDGISDIMAGHGVFSKEYWKPPVDENGQTNGFANMLFYGQRVLTLLPAAVLDVGKRVFDKVKVTINKVKETMFTVWSMSKSSLSNILSGDETVFSKDYWTPPSEKDGAIGGVSNGLFFAQRILTLLPAGVLSVGRAVYDKMSKTWNNLKDTVGTMWSMSKSSLSNILSGEETVFSKEYWTAPSADDSQGGGISKGLFFAQRILTLLPAAVLSVGRAVYDKISKTWDNLKSTVSTMWSMSKSSFSNILSGDETVFSAKYWTAPDADDENGGGISKGLFFAQRILTLLPAAVLSVGRKVYDTVSGVWNNLKSTVSTMWSMSKSSFSNILSGDETVFSATYWNAPTADDSKGGGISKGLFFAQRILTLLPAAVLSVGRKVYDTVSPVIGKVKDSITSVWDMTKQDFSSLISGESTVFSSNYWKAPSGDDATGGIGKGLFYAQRVLTFLPAAVISIGKTIGDKVANAIGTVKDLGATIKEYANVDGDDLNSSYFKFPGGNDDNSLTSGVEKVAFYITRAVMLPIAAVKKIFNGIADAWNSVVQWLKDKGGKLLEAFNVDLDSMMFSTGGLVIENPPLKKKSTQSKQTKGMFDGIGGQTDEVPDGVGGPLDMYNEYKVTSKYGYRTIGGAKKWHAGVDLSKGNNSTVESFFPGTVIKINNTEKPDSGYLGNKAGGGGYGNYVAIKDSINGYTHIYAHLNGVDNNIKVGSTVQSGQPIGLQGHTGNSTGSHLHYQVNKSGMTYSTNTDPVNYLKANSSNAGSEYTGSGNMSINPSSNSSGQEQQTGFAALSSKLSNMLSSSMEPLTAVNTQLSNLLNTALGSSSTTSSTNVNNDGIDDYSSSGSLTSYVNGSKDAIEATIWKSLLSMGYNKYGVAGLMGNLFAESGLSPNNLQNSYEKKLGYTDDSYTKAVDDGTYSKFGSDEAGYGLAQWTYKTRKKNLLEFARKHGKSISDLAMQLIFLNNEMTNSYAGVDKILRSATSVQDASDKVLLDFERPASGSSKKGVRAGYGLKYYNKYANMTDSELSNIALKTEQGGIGGIAESGFDYNYISDSFKKYNLSNNQRNKYLHDTSGYVKTTSTDPNIEYFEKVVRVLIEIAENTGSSSETLSELKDVMSEKTNTSMNVNKNTEVNKYNVPSNKTKKETQKEYQTAKAIARGTPA